jgi:hypothetical protein
MLQKKLIGQTFTKGGHSSKMTPIKLRRKKKMMTPLRISQINQRTMDPQKKRSSKPRPTNKHSAGMTKSIRKSIVFPKLQWGLSNWNAQKTLRMLPRRERETRLATKIRLLG